MFKTGFFALICALLLLSALTPLSAQCRIDNLHMEYSENFNSLPASSGANNSLQWTNNQTLQYWYAARTDYAGLNSFPMRATDGSYGGPHFCSFRTSNPTGANRSLGAIAAANANNQKVHFAWGVRFKNETGAVLRRVTVTYAMEQWRKSESTNEQPLRFSYKVSGSPITSLSADENAYSKVPFLNAMSPVTAGAATALDGNLAANRVVVTHSFNITVNNNEEIMLKWFDEDDSKVDHGLSIDDLNVVFSTSTGTFDAYTGAMSFEQFMKSVILDIPDEGSSMVYVAPTASQRGSWQNAITKILQGQYAAAADSLDNNGLGYRLTQFVAGAKTYYIASKDGASGNYWGTYVFSPSAARACVSFQAPHPLHDAMTGEQATYMFRQLDAQSLMVAGAHRCLNSTPSGCAGTTDACGNNVPYRISDMAHTLESVFQTTTEVLANNAPNRRFIQLHGFEKTSNDPFFIISNGTRQTPNHDFVEQLGESLETAGGWNYEAPHLDTSYNKLIATTNTQGRFLNNYNQGDLCAGTHVSTSVTSRFLHIEQFNAMRTNPANYPTLANALLANEICDCAITASKPTAATPQAMSASGNFIGIRYNANTPGAITCHIETEKPMVLLTVYNLVGQIVFQEEVTVSGNADIGLQTANLPQGAYIATATFGTERRSVKFIVQGY